MDPTEACRAVVEWWDKELPSVATVIAWDREAGKYKRPDVEPAFVTKAREALRAETEVTA